MPVPAVLEQDLVNAYGHQEVDRSSFRSPTSLLDKILYEQLGLMLPTVPTEYPVTETWDRIRKFLSEWNGSLERKWHTAVIAFVMGMLKRRVPQELYDLHPDHLE